MKSAKSSKRTQNKNHAQVDRGQYDKVVDTAKTFLYALHPITGVRFFRNPAVYYIVGTFERGSDSAAHHVQRHVIDMSLPQAIATFAKSLPSDYRDLQIEAARLECSLDTGQDDDPVIAANLASFVQQEQ